MNKSAFIAAMALGIGLSGAALAQQKMDDMKGMDIDGKSKATSKAAHSAKGTVKKIDAGASTVVFDHEPVKSMNWPAMTMSFKVKDKALLKKLDAGKKVEFDFVQDGKDYVVTSVK